MFQAFQLQRAAGATSWPFLWLCGRCWSWRDLPWSIMKPFENDAWIDQEKMAQHCEWSRELRKWGNFVESLRISRKLMRNAGTLWNWNERKVVKNERKANGKPKTTQKSLELSWHPFLISREKQYQGDWLMGAPNCNRSRAIYMLAWGSGFVSLIFVGVLHSFWHHWRAEQLRTFPTPIVNKFYSGSWTPDLWRGGACALAERFSSCRSCLRISSVVRLSKATSIAVAVIWTRRPNESTFATKVRGGSQGSRFRV